MWLRQPESMCAQRAVSNWNEIGLRNNNNITCGIHDSHYENAIGRIRAECRRDDCQTFLAQSSTLLAHHCNRRITSHIQCAIEFYIIIINFSLCIEWQSANEWSLIFRTKCISVPSEKCDKFSFKRCVMRMIFSL